MTHPRSSIAAILIACAALGGCATKPTLLYQWEGYPDLVAAYFRADQLSPDVQTQKMEEGLQKIQTEGGVAPPGYHAHLGLLYAHQGRLDQFAAQIQAEKKQYPESAPFMDFLLRNFKK